MEERIREAVGEALANVGVPNVSFAVERPTDMNHGDYATNAALVAAKQLKREPLELASELAGRIEYALGDSVVNVVVAGPGFVNIALSLEAVTSALAEADAKGALWGRSARDARKRILIEYGNPNPFKEMHIGHMMGAVVGEAFARLIESGGAKVARDTFGGDVGPHVAKAIWGLKKAGITEPATAKEIGKAYAEGARAYEEDPQAEAEIDALNQALYAGTDQALMSQWAKGREISMEEFRRIWRILGTKFDFEFFDSDTVESGMRIVRDGLAKGVFKESDGAVIYDGEAEENEKRVHTMVFITSHGTPTYEAKDIGLAFLKEERWPSDRVVVVTANEQTGRFKTVLAALDKLAPQLAAKTEHVAHGFLRLTSGKMSSREGNIITADGLIREVMAKALEKNPDPLIAEQVAVGAIKYMILRQAPGQDIIFDEEKSLSLLGDSGPYLQYALVRARSVLEKASQQARADASDAEVQENPYLLERLVMHFPEVVARASQERSPNLLTTYLTELAGEWNSFYAKERIIGGEHEARKLLIVRAFANTMANGLTILGIPTPDKM